ncbi:MAG TPA: hypothetical protein PKJ36_11075 [Flavihumibacter sp.]|nr:hypothetical protein [Flavihumibacter sp.]
MYMSTQDPFVAGETKKLPSLLNVLTILTFIGSAYAILSSLWNFSQGRKGVDDLEKLQDSGQLDNAPEFVKKMAGPEMLELAKKMYENRVPLLIITLVGCALCIYGAMQMRKLNKSGFYLYTIGEIFPIVAAMIFVGGGMMTGMMGILFSLLIPVVFVALYASQLKYMK